MKNTNTNKKLVKVFISQAVLWSFHISLGHKVPLDPSKMVGDTILPNCLVVNSFFSLQL